MYTQERTRVSKKGSHYSITISQAGYEESRFAGMQRELFQTLA
jgi:hypothetical protein